VKRVTQEFAVVGEIMILLRLRNGWGNDHKYEEAKKCNQRRIEAAISHGLGAQMLSDTSFVWVGF